jgi:hypothetical protein
MRSTPFPLFPPVVFAPVFSRTNSRPATTFADLNHKVLAFIILLRRTRAEVPEKCYESQAEAADMHWFC